nr:GIY-YIG nuclease family protein [Acidobacteriota bacterium]
MKPRPEQTRCGAVRDRRGLLYLLNIPGTQLYKIGVSKYPVSRLLALRRHGSPTAQIVEQFDLGNGYRYERYWHELFSQERRSLVGSTDGKTEWFELEEKVAGAFLLFNYCLLASRTAATRGYAELQMQPDTLTKKEAAERLGVSTRLVEKYAGEGRLGQVTYVRGKTGKQAVYQTTSVETLKAELESVDQQLAPTNSRSTGLVGAEYVTA